MTHEQFDREMRYGAAMAVTRVMRTQGVITEKDYRAIDTMYKAKYLPVIGGLQGRLPAETA